MRSFNFSYQKNAIINLISNAEVYLRIISFQFTDEEFIRKYILPKSKQLRIQIITNPEDSFSRTEERARISRLFRELEYAGIEVLRSQWEIGEPRLSNSSQSGDSNEGGGDKWYSMHGKLIFSEKQALVLTANFTDSKELESYLLIDEKQVIDECNNKFNFLKDLFIIPNRYPGKIYEMLDPSTQYYVNTTKEKSNTYNILDYPPSLISTTLQENGLVITPFDGVARSYLYQLIDKANGYIFLSSERLFDEGLVTQLIRKKQIANVDIRLITSPPYLVRDNQEKAEQMILNLLSNGVNIRFFDDIHAKCWMTENKLAIGSANLGQMNLGIKKPGNRWRTNTEIIFFDSNEYVIQEGYSEYIRIYNSGTNALECISTSRRSLTYAQSLFGAHKVRSSSGAKVALSLITTSSKIQGLQQQNNKIQKIVEISIRLKEHRHHSLVEPNDVISAFVRYSFSERKQDIDQLFENTQHLVKSKDELLLIIDQLEQEGFIENEGGFYKNCV